MFKKADKLKVKSPDLKVTPDDVSATAHDQGQVTDQTARQGGRLAVMTPPEAPRGKSNAPSRGEPFIVFEKPDRFSVAGLTLAVMACGGMWLSFFGAGAPYMAQLFEVDKSDGGRMFSESLLAQAIKRDPRNPWLHERRSNVLNAMGRYRDALEEANAMVSLTAGKDRLALRYAMRADILDHLHRDGDVRKDLAMAAAVDKSSANYFHRRAFYNLENIDNPAEAIRLENLAITIDPSVPKFFLNRSNGEEHTGQYQKAVDDATTGLQLIQQGKGDSSNNLEIQEKLFNNRAEAYYALGNYQAAIADALKGCEMAPAAAKRVAAQTGQPEYEPYPRAYRIAAMAYLAAGDYAKTLAFCDQSLKVIDKDGPLSTFRILARDGLHRQAEADRVTFSSETGAEAVEFFRDAAQHYLTGNDYKNALLMANMSLRVVPQQVQAYKMRGQANFGLGRYKEAIADFDIALKDLKTKNIGNQALIFHERSVAKEKIGDAAGAKEDQKQSDYYRSWFGDR